MMDLIKTVIFTFLTLSLETKCESIEFKWKFTLDADDPKNYIEENYNLDCQGFYFPDFKDICMMSLDKLRTNEIFFPKTGDIYLKEGAEIIFDPTIKHCIRVKSSSYKKFVDPNSWVSKRTGNRAVPDLERIPCHCDQVSFPNNSLYAMKSPSFLYFVKEINYGMVLNDYSCPLIISTIDQRIGSIGFCEDDKLCQMKGKSKQILNELCPLLEEKNDCFDGVELLGHCKKFCGAVIHIKNDFYVNPDEILKFLNENEDNLDVYSSKMIRNDDFIIQQISITDKNSYNGYSSMKIAENAEEIKRLSKKLGITSIEISISGPPSNQNQKSTFLIIFCTLIFVVAVFGVIFGVFETDYFNFGRFRFNWFNNQRFNLARYNQALRRSVIFSRFDNNENVSIGGSVMNLRREEFDNPLYGAEVDEEEEGGGEREEKVSTENENVGEEEIDDQLEKK